MAVLWLCPHMAEREKALASSSSYKDISAINVGSAFMTSFKPNYLPNTITQALRHMDLEEWEKEGKTFSPQHYTYLKLLVVTNLG